jgi:hypothetical protein
MQPARTALIFVLMVSAAVASSASAATQVFINPDNLPSEPGTSFSQAWATVTADNSNVLSCWAERPDGSQAVCDVCRPDGCTQCTPITCDPQVGNWAFAKATATGNQETGDAYLGGSSDVIKCTAAGCQKFGASVAYAQFGWSNVTEGTLEGLDVQVLLNDGLKLVGNSEPTDYRIRVMVTDLPPRALNATLLRMIMSEKEFDKYREQGYAVATPPNVFLELDVELRPGRSSPVDVKTARGNRVCPHEYHQEEAPRECRERNNLLVPGDFIDHCSLSHPPPTCGGTHVHRKSKRMSVPLWIPVQRSNVSISQIKCMRHRRPTDPENVDICFQVPVNFR